LTAQLQRDLCAFVRAGAYPHAAAEALGIPRAVFARWLRRGRAFDGPRALRDLVDAVRRAAAEARITAEHEVRKDDALNWLKFGPGKERPGRPGWSNPASANAEEHGNGPGALERWLRAFVPRLLDVLEPFPDARQAVAALVDAMTGKR
jgi:hypothetical protein